VKIAFISSVGGHLTDLLALSEAWAPHERVWILNDRSPVLPESEAAYVISHAERDWRVLWNVFELAALLSRLRPDVVVSMGAGPAVPGALVARLAGIPVIYVEPASAVTEPTLTGRMMRRLASRFYVQWPELRDKLPWATYAGRVL
jgi:UDP-N-acetylglucosamine:LPS N-acetylglucosamine transferase